MNGRSFRFERSLNSMSIGDTMFRFVRAGLILISVAGCAAPTPVAENFASSTQKKVRAAQHWNVIAQDVATGTRAFLDDRKLGHRLVDIPRHSAATPFEYAFHDFLTASLLSKGQRLMENGYGGLKLDFTAQVVRHQSGRGWSVPGPITALAAGVLVGRNALDHWSSLKQGQGLLALSVGVDALTGGNLWQGTVTELIVTTTLREGGEVLMRRSEVYYLPDQDEQLYLPPPPPAQIRSAWDW